jgi:hypothetical protein
MKRHIEQTFAITVAKVRWCFQTQFPRDNDAFGQLSRI